MLQRHSITALALALLAFTAAHASGASPPTSDLDVPADRIPGEKPGEMMKGDWQRHAEAAFQRWQAEYETRTKPEAVAAYQQALREKFRAAVGGLPERTPLNPQVTGTVVREGYRVEKISFESQPKHFVTALLFLPAEDRCKPPYPGVLVPCGHAKNAKGHDEYQTVGAFLALSGMAALVFD